MNFVPNHLFQHSSNHIWFQIHILQNCSSRCGLCWQRTEPDYLKCLPGSKKELKTSYCSLLSCCRFHNAECEDGSANRWRAGLRHPHYLNLRNPLKQSKDVSEEKTFSFLYICNLRITWVLNLDCHCFCLVSHFNEEKPDETVNPARAFGRRCWQRQMLHFKYVVFLMEGGKFTIYFLGVLPLIDCVCSQKADRKCEEREGKGNDDM